MYLSVPMGNVSAPDSLSGEEQSIVYAKLWQFLGKQTERYTMGDSSSVPIETAQELLTSVCFTLDVYLKASNLTAKLLVTENLDVLFEEGRKLLKVKIAEGQRLWQSACISAPDIENISYRDTLRSIGSFFRCYDYRFLAHQIPCNIDYQLCRPVPEHHQGVEYVYEYLRRMVTENTILRRFSRDFVIRLLDRYCPDYKGLLINLCEPVIANAVGLSLLRKAPFPLLISDVDRLAIMKLFAPLPETKARETLTEAAGRFCRTVGLESGFTREYVAQAATDLFPRIAASVPTGSLAGIFL